MNTNYYEHDYENLICMYDDVCNWFSDLGFEYSKNRYGTYKKLFEKFTDIIEGKYKDPDLLKFKRSFDNAYIEANEIIRINNYLSEIDTSEFIEQIKK